MYSEENTIDYIKVVGYIVFVILALVLFMHDHSYTCDDYANDFKNDVDFGLVLIHKSHNGRNVYLLGQDLKSHSIRDYDDGGGGLLLIYEKMNVNDTIIKKKGKYQVVIKRKQGTIVLPYICGDKGYQN